MSGPLEGLKVLELGGIGPTSYAGMLLADSGAEVLRLERGDSDASNGGPGDILNRSRYSVAVDLKSDGGRELVLELCEHADVLIEGFRPGVTERLGLGPEDALSRNPRLVYGRMTGYGQEGPLSDRAGHDINYISISGALWAIGRVGERPVPPLNLVGDFGGGAMFLLFGVLAAVWSSQRTGKGQVVDAAMVDGSASMMAMTHSFVNSGLWTNERGVNFLDTGAPFYEVYETKDHLFMAVGAVEPQFYSAFVSGLGIPESEVPQWDRARWPDMKKRVSQVFLSKTRDEWIDIFQDVDACVTPVLATAEAPHHRYNTERDVFTKGDAPQPRPAPRFSRTPSAIGQRGPGAGTRVGLSAWGVSDQRIAELRERGAFGASLT
ncbi:MAG: L-carnitine dehydratase/bile acid-inducible protein [Acidimicrobiaceae bacterium]|nr:L-carnitine dehydratase/bile acid-inducible protein [Acidimicrobiaceae bacterium]